MQVRKLAKQAAIDAREAALAAEEVQAMAAQLADRQASSAPSSAGHDRVGPLQVLALFAGAAFGQRESCRRGCPSCASQLPAGLVLLPLGVAASLCKASSGQCMHMRLHVGAVLASQRLIGCRLGTSMPW